MVGAGASRPPPLVKDDIRHGASPVPDVLDILEHPPGPDLEGELLRVGGAGGLQI